MGYSEIYEELNHQVEERFELMEERIAQICSKAETKEQFADYFQKNAAFLLMLARFYRDKKDSKSATELKQQNFKLYEDILPEAYQEQLCQSGICHQSVWQGAWRAALLNGSAS